MSEPLLSILICSLEERKDSLSRLLLSLMRQCGELLRKETEMVGSCVAERYIFEQVEIIVATDNRQITTGAKRNILYQMGKGKKLASADDDDNLATFYVEEMLKGCATECDAVVFNGLMTTDGANARRWKISKDYKYCKAMDEHANEIYLRYPNHLAGIRREIAQAFPFQDKVFGEDFSFATAIHEAGVIKTEFKIEREPLYIYNFISNK